MIFQRPTVKLFAVISIVSLLGAAILAVASATWDGNDELLLASLVILVIGTEIADFSPLPNSSSSLSIAVVLAAGTTSGLAGVALIGSVAIITDLIAHRDSFDRRIVPSLSKATFNLGALLVSGAAYVGVLELFAPNRDPGEWLPVLGPALCGASIAFAINSSLLAVAISLETRQRIAAVWSLHCRWALPHFHFCGVLAVFLAAAYQHWEIGGLALLIAPLAMAWLTMKHHAETAARPTLIIRR